MIKKIKNGFTLVEFTLVIVILGIIASMGSEMLRQGFLSGFLSTNLNETSWQARLALQRIANELIFLRKIDAGSNLQTNQLTFRDINYNPITFSLSGNNIMRKELGFANDQAVAIAQSITNLTFKYVAADGSYMAQPISDAQLKYVKCIYVSANVVWGTFSLPLQTIICPKSLI